MVEQGQTYAAGVKAQAFGQAHGLHQVFAALTGLCLVLTLSACSGDRLELGVDIPPAYKAAHGASIAGRPALDWWRGFRSPELTRLIEEAQTANFDIAAAIGRIMQADAQSKIVGAALLPAIDFNGNVTRSRASQAGNTGGGIGGGGGSERVSYNLALNASYEIDFWGKNRALSRAAQENAIAARFDRDTVAVSTVVTVATAYFLVVTSQERLRSARQNLASAERVLTLVRQRFEAGTASALEVAQQETLVATQRAVIPQLDQTLRQNMAILAVLVGRAPANLKVRGGSLYRLGIPRVSPGLPSELLLQRPDIRSAETQLAGSSANVEAARAAFFPTISLTGQYGIVSAALKSLFTPQAIFYNVAANLAQPVFDGFRLEGQLELAQGRQVELLELYRRAVVSGFGDVEQALIAIADTTERERLQRQVVESSRRAFEIGETRLREGTVDLVTVLIIQQSLFQAEDNLAIARQARLQAVLSLFQALCGAWLPPAEGTAVKLQ
jgi:outer membrane protein, multidrug efflux system